MKRKHTQLNVRKSLLLNYFLEAGKPYTSTVIDREPVVYCKLPRFDFEISGGRYRGPFIVYVWELSPTGSPQHIVAKHTVPSTDIPAAAEKIDRIVATYKEKPNAL